MSNLNFNFMSFNHPPPPPLPPQPPLPPLPHLPPPSLPPNPMVATAGFDSNLGSLSDIQSAYGKPSAPPPPIISAAGQFAINPPRTDEEHRQECAKFISKCKESSNKRDVKSPTPETEIKRPRRTLSPDNFRDDPDPKPSTRQKNKKKMDHEKNNVEEDGEEGDDDDDDVSNMKEMKRYIHMIEEGGKERATFEEVQKEKSLVYVTTLVQKIKYYEISMQKMKADKERKSKLKQLLEETNQKLGSAEDELAQFKKDLKITTAAYESEEKQGKALTKKVSDLQKKNEALKKTNYDLNVELEEAQKKLNKQDLSTMLHKTEMDIKTQDIKTLEEEVQGLRDNLGRQEIERQKQLKEQTMKLNEALSDADRWKQETERLQRENYELNNRLKQFETSGNAFYIGFVKSVQHSSSSWSKLASQIEKDLNFEKSPNLDSVILSQVVVPLPTKYKNKIEEEGVRRNTPFSQLNSLLLTIGKEVEPEMMRERGLLRSLPGKESVTPPPPIKPPINVFENAAQEIVGNKGFVSRFRSPEVALNLSVADRGRLEVTASNSSDRMGHSSTKNSSSSMRRNSFQNSMQNDSALHSAVRINTPPTTPPSYVSALPGVLNHPSPQKTQLPYQRQPNLNVSIPSSRHTSTLPLQHCKSPDSVQECQWCKKTFDTRMQVVKHTCDNPQDPRLVKQGIGR